MHELPLSGIPASISDICIAYVYIYISLQTQPIPNPLSYYLHQTPEPLHKIETLTNHVVELACPFLLLLPRPLGSVGGLIQILFQVRALSDHQWLYSDYIHVCVRTCIYTCIICVWMTVCAIM